MPALNEIVLDCVVGLDETLEVMFWAVDDVDACDLLEVLCLEFPVTALDDNKAGMAGTAGLAITLISLTATVLKNST